jgi:hypothetical protein
MTERTTAISMRTSEDKFFGGEVRITSNGNQSFKPSKPANLVRPQGIKPPPPRRSK